MTFYIHKQFQEIPENTKIIGKTLIFLINLKIAPSFFQISP
jgi:hypothetical protein